MVMAVVWVLRKPTTSHLCRPPTPLRVLMIASAVAKCLHSPKLPLKVPMPFVSVRVKKETGFSMPFVRASVIVKPYDDGEEENMPPKDVFDDAWCLWDTGAQSIMILTRMLSPEVRGGEEDGCFGYWCRLFSSASVTK